MCMNGLLECVPGTLGSQKGSHLQELELQMLVSPCVLDPDPGPLQEQLALFATETSLQP